MIRRGQIHWVSLEKRRPAVVVSPDYRNERASHVIVVPATSRIRESPTRVVLRRGEGGLPRPCALNAEQVIAISKFDIDPVPIGALDAKRMVEVERAILRALGIAI